MIDWTAHHARLAILDPPSLTSMANSSNSPVKPCVYSTQSVIYKLQQQYIYAYHCTTKVTLTNCTYVHRHNALAHEEYPWHDYNAHYVSISYGRDVCQAH